MDWLTGRAWSWFLTKKSKLSPTMVHFVQSLATKGVKVGKFRCDDAGENHTFKEDSNNILLDVEFEFTGRETPQYNGKVERLFATILGRYRAMADAAHLPRKVRLKLSRLGLQHALLLYNGTARKDGAHECPFVLFDGHIPKSFANLHEFGQAGMVKFQGKNTCKTDNRGAKMMYVGVPVDHPVDCFLMYNLSLIHI